MAFIGGFIMLIGVWGTMQFFIRRTKIRGSLVFFGGLFVIIMGFPGFTIIGFLMQVYGTILLFR
jgi:hypothetical protein